MIFQMLRWWYVSGWMQAARKVVAWPQGIERAFSLSLLVRTMFAPWRRIVTASGRSLDAQMRAALDNLISRLVGFVIRFFVLIGAGVAMLVALAAGCVMAVVWPFLPLLVPALAVKGIIG